MHRLGEILVIANVRTVARHILIYAQRESFMRRESSNDGTSND